MKPRTFATSRIRYLIFGVCFGIALCPAIAIAQEPPPVPRSASEPQGLVPEPDPILRLVLFADRHLGKGDLNNGLYINQANMIPGAGWVAVGPGYRHWYGKDQIFVDAAAGISWTGFKLASTRLELPTLAHNRVSLATEARWLDFNHVNEFAAGPESSRESLSAYQIRTTHFVGSLTVRPVQWFGIGASIGWMNPSVHAAPGHELVLNAPGRETFVPAEVALMIDTRDFPGHPTRGGLLRAGATRYNDHGSGALAFRRYDGEVAGFLPIAGARVVLALHGWLVATAPEAGKDVPFYLEPSLGGANTLRSYSNFRFHDRNMFVANAEVRVAMMTHMDLALFADAGNVAHRLADVNLNKQDYGAGLRFHTSRDTFALLDVARGKEGWRVLFRMSDPLQLARLTRRAVPVPFVP